MRKGKVEQEMNGKSYSCLVDTRNRKSNKKEGNWGNKINQVYVLLPAQIWDESLNKKVKLQLLTFICFQNYIFVHRISYLSLLYQGIKAKYIIFFSFHFTPFANQQRKEKYFFYYFSSFLSYKPNTILSFPFLFFCSLIFPFFSLPSPSFLPNILVVPKFS